MTNDKVPEALFLHFLVGEATELSVPGGKNKFKIAKMKECDAWLRLGFDSLTVFSNRAEAMNLAGSFVSLLKIQLVRAAGGNGLKLIVAFSNSPANRSLACPSPELFAITQILSKLLLITQDDMGG